jgi:hypothetical protein
MEDPGDEGTSFVLADFSEQNHHLDDMDDMDDIDDMDGMDGMDDMDDMDNMDDMDDDDDDDHNDDDDHSKLFCCPSQMSMPSSSSEEDVIIKSLPMGIVGALIIHRWVLVDPRDLYHNVPANFCLECTILASGQNGT